MCVLRDLDTKTGEIASLKRRLEGTDSVQSDVKRLRFDVQERDATVARRDTELRLLTERLEVLTRERDDASRKLLSMEGDISILRAEKALHDAQKSFQ